ncbi:MAG: AraC family transcriptional regulator [Clostridiales bacterium]|nr:AraC family transcriptional regulator [Clostridiales bacterium]
MSDTFEYKSSPRFQQLLNQEKDSIDLSLFDCGWEVCKPSHRYGPNKRNFYLLHMVCQGRGFLDMDGKKWQLEKGDIFLIPMGKEAWYEADAKEPWSYMWIGFVGVKSEECLEMAGITERKPVRRIQCIETLRKYIDEIMEMRQYSYANELKRNGLLMIIFSALVEDYENSLPIKAGTENLLPISIQKSNVRYAVEYIVQHYSETLKINELAEMIGVSRSYLSVSFKKSTGHSPQEFLIAYRLEKAAALLKKTDLPVSAVANAVGYPDQLAFSKIFKRRYGVSPRSYKEKTVET